MGCCKGGRRGLRACVVAALASWVAGLMGLAHAGTADAWDSWSAVLFQRVKTADALADSMGAMAFAQDRDGFLWVGTQNGLMRWDGYRYRVYNSEPDRRGGLPDSFLQALHVDVHGQLWIGTASHGLVRYRARSDDFESLAVGPQGLSHVSINSLADAADGGVWVGTAGGLDHVDPSGRTVARAPLPAAATGATPEHDVRAVVAGRGGSLWVGTAQGLFRGDAQGRGFVPVPLAGTTPETRQVRSLMEDSLGRLWIALDTGMRLLDPKTGEVRVLGERGAASSAVLRRERVYSMLETGTGEVWLGTRGAGIIVVDLQTLKTRSFVRKPGAPYGLDSNDIWTLYRDPSGLIWVGTIDSVLRVQGEPTAARTIVGGVDAAGLLSTDEAGMVVPLPDGRLMIGAGFRGVDIVDPLKGRVGGLRPDARRPDDALPQARVVAGTWVADHGVFLATPKGLYLASASGAQVRRVQLPGRSPAEEVDALHHDEHGLWLGGRDGLWQVRFGAQREPVEVRHDPQAQGLSDQRIVVIAPAATGRLWVGTRNGLNLFDQRSGRALAVLLRGAFVTSVLADAGGRLWVGTAANGLYVIEAPLSDAPAIRHFGVRDGLPNDAVNTILFDDSGRAWLSTDQGLAVVDPESLRIRALGPSDGVGIAQYWTGAGARTADGDLLFGGLGGAVVVTPRRLAAPKPPPGLVLTELRLGDAAVPVGGFNDKAARGRLTLPPQARGFSAEFSALDFNDARTNRYSYRLAEFDRGWIETDATRRNATYTNVPPGDYVLEVRAAHAGSGWSDPLRIDIVAEPAWHQTLWFRLLLLAAALLAIAGLDRARHLLLVRRQRELQQLVDERTAALQASEARLAQMAYFDVLTGLPNRRMLIERHEQLLAHARRADTGFALLMIDLDRFKQVNDSLGHAAGDALLVTAAERLRGCVREVDTVARLGGDEFAVLLDEAESEQGVETVCRRIVEAFHAPAVHGSAQLATSPSIGAALYPRHGHTLDDLSQAADKALYEAKAAGRNTWRIATAA